MNWTYNGKEFTQGDVGSSFGFVYCIHNLVDKKRYIGKKFFTVAGRKQVKGKKKKIRKPSDWETYWGSNNTLIDDVKKHAITFKDSYSPDNLNKFNSNDLLEINLKIISTRSNGNYY